MEKHLKRILETLGKEIKIKEEENSMILLMNNIEFDIYFSTLIDFFQRLEPLKRDISSIEKPKLFFERLNKFQLNMENFSRENNVEIGSKSLIMKYYKDLLPKDFESKLEEFSKENHNKREKEINLDDILKFIPKFGSLFSQQKNLNRYKARKVINVEILSYLMNKSELEFFNAILCFVKKIFVLMNNDIQILEFDGTTSIFFNISIPELIDVLQVKVRDSLIKNGIENNGDKLLEFYEMDFLDNIIN